MAPAEAYAQYYPSAEDGYMGTPRQEGDWQPASKIYTQDDFGRAIRRPLNKGKGMFTPRHKIGVQVTDLREVMRPEGTYSACGGTPSKMDYGSMCPTEVLPEKRLRKEAKNPQTGKVIDLQRPSSGKPPRPSMARVDYIPLPQKDPRHGAKRCFDYVYKPTGLENTVQYEEPVEPGKRPSHPVCADGIVALEHKRGYPEIQNAKTSIPPPKLCKPPHGSWGGWAGGGAPGRRRQDGPWDSVQPKSGSDDIDQAEFRFCDARTRRFPEMKYNSTFHITAWHLDPERDIDEQKHLKVHLNDAVPIKNGARRYGAEVQSAAGRPSGMPVEGAALSFYDKVREHDELVAHAKAARALPRAISAPHSARF